MISDNRAVLRKKYLDNIRWITIVLVVIFHVFFYYNNIGIEPMFTGVREYSGQITFAGLFQYFVYPWFMLLLFVVAGMSARYALKKKTVKQFLHSRIDKILVPSTLGVIVFGSLGGYIIFIHNAAATLPEGTPGFVGVIIAVSSGIGALWFCHVLFVATLVLLLVRWILKRCHQPDEKIGPWMESYLYPMGRSLIVLGVLFLLFWGGSHFLNMPVITSYRNGIYIPAFLAGYYVFSTDRMIEHLKKIVIPLFILSCASGIFYIYRCYGLYYGDADVLKRWDVNLYAFLMVLFALGAGAKVLDFNNRFTDYMSKRSFGIYVIHIPVMLVTNYLLIGKNLPMPIIYLIELVCAFVVSIVLYEIISRIPILRYWILGIRKRNNC